MRNVALDLGARTIAYSEARDGKIVERTTVRSLGALQALLGPNTPRARVLFEACREAWRVHDVLEQWGHVPLMLDTTRAKQVGIGQHKRKNDRLDGDALALALDRGSVPLAHVLSEPRRELRYQLEVRRALVETRARQVTVVRGIVRARGRALPSCAVEDFVARLERTELDEATRALVTPLAETLRVLDQQIQLVDAKLEQLSAGEPVIQQLQTTRGVGPILSTAFVAVIDNAGRFRRAHQVESYVGLVPSEDSSGGRQRLGGISKQGNSYLRSLLIQAAWCILRLKDDDPLKLWGQAVAERRGKRIAVVAIARRLVGILWSMWRNGTVYDPAHLGKHMARGTAALAQSAAQRAAALERAAAKTRRRPKTTEGNRR